MRDQILISFVVPVHNREDTLRACMKSLLDSKWRNFEIILVDDASTDTSPALCDCYAEQYSFIQSIHLSENRGPGAARNCGIAQATGKWIFFLDSDDLVCTENLQNIATQIKELPDNVDLIAVDNIDELNGKTWDFPYFQKFALLTSQEFYSHHAMRLCSPLWCYIFRRDYIARHHLQLPPLYIYEDTTFMLKYCQWLTTVACIPGSFYRYRARVSNNSLVAQSHISFPLAGFTCYIKTLCAFIKKADKEGDFIRKKIYTQHLINYSLEIPRLLTQSPIQEQWDAGLPVLQTDMPEEQEAIQLTKSILYRVLQQMDGKKCFLAPGNQTAAWLADYLADYNCEVLGVIDNHVRSVVTPQGRTIPVCTREDAGEICGCVPIYIVTNSYLRAKLEKYFYEHGMTVAHWMLKTSE